MLRPVSFRRMIAASESSMGIAHTAKGAAKATVAASLVLLRRASAPRTRPMIMLPASPK